jgi:DNA polymerase V
MYINQRRRKMMSLQLIKNEFDGAVSVPGSSKGDGSSKESFSPSLTGDFVLSRFKEVKGNQKYKRDLTSLPECGPIKFTKLSLPYFLNGVSAGSPSNVDDPYTRHLDLTKYLIRYPKSAYYFKVTGYSMVKAGISDKDILVVDTALKPKHKDIIIAKINGEVTVKHIHMEGPHVILFSDISEFHFVTIDKDIKFFIQGVVTTVIRTFNPLR